MTIELHTTLRPEPHRYELARGMKGTDVAALQINLRKLKVDAWFGARTEERVRQFQDSHGIEPLGIAGTITNAKLIDVRSRAAEKAHELPRRFLYSKAAKESGLKVAAYAKHPDDWGFDLGAFQLAFGPHHREATQQRLAMAYDVSETADDVAATAREDYERFLRGAAVEQGNWYGTELAGGKPYSPKVFAWQLVALAHNWPGAAENLAVIGRVFWEQGADDEAREWIEAATGGRLSSAREWVMDYVPGATIHVRWHTI
jgi:hypothetical protein